MVKSEILKILKDKYPNLSINQIEIIFDIVFNSISDALIKSRNVEIRSFGTFSIKKLAENKSARNPQTGELIYVPSRKKVRYKASNTLNKLINKKK